MYKTVHTSFIQNSFKQETNQMFINNRVDKYILVYSYNGIL